jgi:hypothetical protein
MPSMVSTIAAVSQKNAELMAESEDLKLQQRAAPEGSENSGPESGQ